MRMYVVLTHSKLVINLTSPEWGKQFEEKSERVDLLGKILAFSLFNSIISAES